MKIDVQMFSSNPLNTIFLTVISPFSKHFHPGLLSVLSSLGKNQYPMAAFVGVIPFVWTTHIDSRNDNTLGERK